MIISVCSSEEYFTTKFEVAPMSRATDQLVFLIRVNNENVF